MKQPSDAPTCLRPRRERERRRSSANAARAGNVGGDRRGCFVALLLAMTGARGGAARLRRARRMGAVVAIVRSAARGVCGLRCSRYRVSERGHRPGSESRWMPVRLLRRCAPRNDRCAWRCCAPSARPAYGGSGGDRAFGGEGRLWPAVFALPGGLSRGARPGSESRRRPVRLLRRCAPRNDRCAWRCCAPSARPAYGGELLRSCVRRRGASVPCGVRATGSQRGGTGLVANRGGAGEVASSLCSSQ